jgi:folate-binding protein YgfZ
VNDERAAQRAAAVRRSVGLFRPGQRALLAVRGADRVRWLDGMLSNDLKQLAPGPRGSGCYALLLSPQGRILADFHVLLRDEEIWLETSRDGFDAVRARLERFVVADDVAFVDRSDEFERLALEGARAFDLLARALGRDPGLAPECGAELDLAGQRVFAAAFGWSGAPALQLFAAPDAAPALVAALRHAAGPSGLLEGDAEVLEILRIEAGVPALRRELDERVLPPETNLMSRAVSLAKGCYTGQEIVARLVSRDAAKHRLVGLRFGAELPRADAEIRAEGELVGTVTSRCRSAEAGPIGLGFVRRPFDTPGTPVEVDGAEARVAALPLVATAAAP